MVEKETMETRRFTEGEIAGSTPKKKHLLTLGDVVDGRITAKRLRYEPTMKSKISAALYISVKGASNSGIGDKANLMWPCVRFNDFEVEREAATLLSTLHTALLEALPTPRIEQILKAQAERLTEADEAL